MDVKDNFTSAPETATWASQSGFYVHQHTNLIAVYGFSEKIKPRYGTDYEKADLVLQQLNSATVYADGAKFQTAEYAYRHVMSNTKIGGVTGAKKKADVFVRKQFKKARKYLAKGDLKNAYWHLGIALHTIQDATSPAHGGFQIWTGEETLAEEAEHVLQEMTWPGPDSNLEKVTI